MKKIYTMLCLLALSIGASAQQAAMRVWTGPEASTLYVFSARPVVKFTPTEIQVVAREAEFSIDKHEYVKFTFEESDIDDGIRQLSDSPTVTFDNGSVTLSNLPEGSTVSAYSINGTLVQQAKANAQGHANVNINNQPSGVYVIRSKAGAFKLLKK